MGSDMTRECRCHGLCTCEFPAVFGQADEIKKLRAQVQKLTDTVAQRDEEIRALKSEVSSAWDKGYEQGSYEERMGEDL